MSLVCLRRVGVGDGWRAGRRGVRQGMRGDGKSESK